MSPPSSSPASGPSAPLRAPASFRKSSKLDEVCYDIRGPVMAEASRMEDEGQRILKLNIGNPAAFRLDAPDELLVDVNHNLANAQGYVDSKGIYPARKAVMQYCQRIGIEGVEVDDVYMGNGVSELIMLAMQALLDNGDEMLVPAPDYPLWTAAVVLSGGKAVHYRCDEQADWQPDLADIRSKVSPRTRGIVLINPNNPTGAVYSRELLLEVMEVAREHNLIVFADEIYDKILYDDAVHVPAGSLAPDLLTVTFGGLSKSWRLAGFRSGWMIVSGAKQRATGYIEGLNILASMRLCANVPAQYAVQGALGGRQSIEDLVAPGGRLRRQRDRAWEMLTAIPGVSCVKPRGALYLFPRLDPARYPIRNDEQLVLDLLRQEKLLLVQGTGFHWFEPDHVRMVFLPVEDELEDAMERFARFLHSYRQ